MKQRNLGRGVVAIIVYLCMQEGTLAVHRTSGAALLVVSSKKSACTGKANQTKSVCSRDPKRGC